MLALLLLVCLFRSNQLLVIQAYTDVSDTFGFLWQLHELDTMRSFRGLMTLFLSYASDIGAPLKDECMQLRHYINMSELYT